MEMIDDHALTPAGTVEDGAWLSPSQAAAAVGVSRQTIYEWIRRGYLTTETVNGAKRIRRGDLRRLGEVRRAAAAVSIRLKTVHGWSNGNSLGGPNDSLMVHRHILAEPESSGLTEI